MSVSVSGSSACRKKPGSAGPVNSFDGTLGTNLLVTYRINALRVFYVGYDDRYQQEDLTALRRTNRAFFTKLRILFLY